MARGETAPSFAGMLRKARLRAGLSQEALAEVAGVATRTVSDLERGINKAPRRDTLDALAGALHLSPADRAAWGTTWQELWDRGGRGLDRAAPDRPERATQRGQRGDRQGPDLPTGTVTFLFTDVEGSTRHWEQDPTAMRAATARHDALVEATVGAHDGVLVRPRGEGDSRFAVFGRASDAVAAAVALQVALQGEAWPTPLPLRVRMALHTGEADLRDGDYYGAAVNRCARLRAVAHGGQVLLSEATHDLVRDSLPVEVSLRDLGEWRLAGLTLPEKAYQMLHPSLRADFPPLNSPDANPNNLPQQLTSFVGRERDIQELSAQLRTTRLLTLTGAGGCGKTRLALEVARAGMDEYPDGVWLVELAPLSDPQLVPQAVASTLGLRDSPGVSPIEATISYLGQREMLLVVDNCEHLADASAHLTQAILRASPRVRVLATSRQRLGVPGETPWRVPPLTVPDPRAIAAAGSGLVGVVDQSEAARLFAQRAVVGAPWFALSGENARAVAQICQRLDGIPLAIELAAARVAVLSVEQIAARLDQRFRLLTGGSRTAPPRQRTLQATIDWSYSLLTPDERTALRRLAVFAGSFGLEAAEAVCDGDGIEEGAVLDLLARLVDWSLVLVEDHGPEARYRMLETIRAYAEERLVEAGERVAARDRHRDWCIAFAEKAEAHLFRADQVLWLERLEAEHDNLRAALGWCRETDRSGGLRLAGALGRFWNRRGYRAEGRRWLADMLAAAPEGVNPSAEAKVLLALARFERDPARARRYLEESVNRFRAIDDRSGLAWALRDFGLHARDRADAALARKLYDESLALFRALGDETGARWTLGFRGSVEHRLGGDRGLARRLYEDALALQRERGDLAGIAQELVHLARLDATEGDYERARERLEEGLSLFIPAGDRVFVAWIFFHLGSIARAQGDRAGARRWFGEGLVRARGIGLRAQMANFLTLLGTMAIEEGEFGRGVRLYGAADAVGVFLRRELAELLGGWWFAGNDAGGNALKDDLVAEWEESGARARAVLGEDSYARAWSEGRAMTLEQAAAYALGTGAADFQRSESSLI